ncbi:putative peptidase family-domain-containing protein [Bipolaris maydis]|nr:putative peptidase family-domain-containing protein [Bipolaris maydis]
MPSFLRSLSRRNSRMPKTDDKSTNGTDKHQAKGLAHRASASTMNSSQVASSTPSTTPATSTTDEVNGPTPPPVPARPQRPNADPVKRYSTNGGPYPAHSGSNGSLNRSSLLARSRGVGNADFVQVHQQVLLIFGQVGEPQSRPLDGTLTVNHHQGRFPSTCWPVHESYFKALVHLEPGWNRNTSRLYLAQGFLVKYLHLPACVLHQHKLFTLDSVSAASACNYTRTRFPRHIRCSSFYRRADEALWFRSSLFPLSRLGAKQYRTQAKIHVIRSKRSVAEIRDLERAQQYGPATKKNELFDFAIEACRDYFHIAPGQKHYVSCLFLDTQWDTQTQTVRGHAALVLSIEYRGSFQAFQDCTRTDTSVVANDCNESGSNWEAANIGIGAHLHETGHLFGCPHQESGIMLRDYVTLNRTFTCREPYSTRTKWHKLDVLRFRFHPCFRIPIDAPMINGDDSVQVWTVDASQGGVIATSKSGIAWVELYTEGDDICRHWKEFPELENQYPRQVTLDEGALRSMLPTDSKKVILDYVHIQTKLLLRIKVYHGYAVDGLEFVYEDTDTQLFGKRGGSVSEFALDIRKGELLLGFALRAGLWIDGLQILTSLGRKSEHTLIPPRGYTIGGISGSCAQWLDGFSLIITR